jgi:hypothetical protein
VCSRLQSVAAVASIIPFLGNHAFDEAATQLLGQVFDAACRELHDKGQPAIVREVIARRIIDAALLGERDPIRLREAGLAGVRRQER